MLRRVLLWYSPEDVLDGAEVRWFTLRLEGLYSQCSCADCLHIHLLADIPHAGDPVYAMLGEDITREQYEIAYKEMGLDSPIHIRYLKWLGNVLRGDLGQSYKYRQPVVELLRARLPVTMYLGVLSLIVSTTVGIIFGILAATKRGKFIDTVISVFAHLGAAMPLFWLGVLGMALFAMYLGWLPSYGFTFPTENLALSVRQTILPLLALSVGGIAGTTRQMRSSLLEVIHQDYIRTADPKA